MKGIIAFDIPFADAAGHLDQWDGTQFSKGLMRVGITGLLRLAYHCGERFLINFPLNVDRLIRTRLEGSDKVSIFKITEQSL
jgi:hypothetical protein